MRRPPGRLLPPLLTLLAAAALIGSCVGNDAPTGVGQEWSVGLPISPALIPSAADAGARPINRIRASAARTSDGVVLGSVVQDVSPTDTEWTIDLEVTLAEPTVDVMVYIHLIHVAGGVESVEFSGLIGPLTLEQGAGPVQPADVPIVRGPIANHFVTGVSISAPPDTLTEGSTATMRAAPTASGSAAPTIYWTVLDSTVLSVTDSTVTALAVGTGRIVASAGAHADTTAIVVRSGLTVTNVDVEIRKTVDDSQPIEGATVTFTVSALNHGPGPVTNVSVFDTLATSAFTGAQHAVSEGSLVGDSLWTIPTLAEGQTATWTTTATVATGVAGGTATNQAVLRALAEADSTPANNAAQVTVSFPFSPVPVVTISQPGDSATFDPGDLVTFTADASDIPDGDLSPSIVWTSSLDGALGTGRSVNTSALSTGVHTIAATATDSHGGAGADTVVVIVSLYSVPQTLNVPFGGTASLPITLSAPAPGGGVTLSVSSDDATVTTPTAATVFIPQGAQSANATLNGVGPGTASVTVGNPQYGNAVSIVSVTAALDILGGTVTFPSPFTADITIEFESQGVAIAAPAGGLPVTLTSRDPACVAVPTGVAIAGGQTTRTATLSYGGSANTTCQAYVVASATDIVPDSVLVSVTSPATITLSARTVGAGLQEGSNGALNATGHGGVTLTLTSSDPSRILVSPNLTTPGTESIDIPMASGSNGYSFYVQGVEGATPGTATVTATAAGFNQGSTTMTLVQPAIALSGPAATTTTLSVDEPFYAFVGIPSGTSVSAQNVRAGGPDVTVTFATDNTGVGLLETSSTSGDVVTATIVPGLYYTPTSVATGGVAHDPVGVGTATITATAQGFTSTLAATGTVTVTAPTITLSARTVGAGLQEVSNGALNATGHPGVTLTLTSSDPATVLVSPNASTPGAASIDVQMGAGANGFGFYVQGVEGATGTATITATASGFLNGTATMTTVQPAIALSGPPTSTTAGAANIPFYAYVGTPSGNGVNAQSVRAGSAGVTVTAMSSNTAAARLVTQAQSGASVTAVIVSGLYYTPTSVATGGFELDPLAEGQTTISASTPGFVAALSASVTVTVNP